MEWNVKNALSRDVEREHLNRILKDIRKTIDGLQRSLEQSRQPAPIQVAPSTPGSATAGSATVGGTNSVIDTALNQLSSAVQDLVAVQEALDAEVQARLEGDLAESQARADAIAAQQEALDAEVQARAAAIAAEQAARIAGDAAEATARANALAAEAAARTQAIQEEANARATALLNEKNERIAAISAEATIRQTADESLAVEIASVAAGTGEQFDSKRIWYFDNDLESWTSNGGTPTIVDGWLRPANHASDPHATSPDNLGIDGGAYRFVKVRIKKVGNPTWRGQLRWITTTDNTFNTGKQVVIPEPDFDANGIATISFKDVPWWPNTIRRIRLQLGASQTATDYFLIDWVAIGRPTPGAGVALVQDEAAARIAGDAAEATQRTTLAAQLRGDYTGTDVNAVTSGLIYSERQARVSGDQANASAISSLQARMPSGSGKLATEASVSEEASARAAADNALSTRVSTVEARMPTGTGQLATAAAVQAVEGRVRSVEGTVNSQSSAITSLTNRVGQAELAGTNKLPNPGFEIDSFWTLQAGWEYADGEGRNGSRCVKRTARAGGGTQVHCDPYRVPVSPGQVWRIRSWYKTTADFNGTPSNSKLCVGDQANSLIDPATAPFTVSTEWKMTERTYTVPADGSVTHLRVSIHGNNTKGTLWVDDVSLENITELSELRNADAANANAISGLTTRVTQTENSLTSHGQAITNLQNSVTGLQGTVATKADASALNALTTRVTNAENVNTSQGNAITQLSNQLTFVLRSGANLLADGDFEMYNAGAPFGVGKIVDTDVRNGTRALLITANGTIRDVYFPPISTAPGRVYYGEAWIKAKTATDSGGQVGLAATLTKDGARPSYPWFQAIAASTVTTTGWTKVSGYITIPEGINRLVVRPTVRQEVKSGEFLFDDVVLYDVTEAKAASDKANANAAAVQALDSRVTAAEGTITSQGSAITRLQNSLTSGENLLPGGWELLGWGGNPTQEGEIWVVTGTLQYAPSSPTIRGLREGEVLDISAEIRANAELASMNLQIRFDGPSATNVIRHVVPRINNPTVGEWYPVSLTTTVPPGCTRAYLQLYGSANGVSKSMRAARVTRRTLSDEANAAAISSLQSTVTQQGDTITSQGNAITSLKNSVTGLQNSKADASALNDLTTRVTNAEGKITAQGNAITSVQAQLSSDNAGDEDWNAGDEGVYAGTLSVYSAYASADQALSRMIESVKAEVAGKASASALQQLESTVERHDDAISAQSNAITAVKAEVAGKANASVVQELTATVETQGNDLAKVLAQYFLSVNANGKIAGMKLGTDGTTSAVEFLADIFRVVSPGTVEGMEWRDGYLRIYGSGYQRILGNNFGVAGDQLVDWFGPNVGPQNASKANAVMWMDKSGNAYWGGSLSAGLIKNSAQSTVISGTASVETGSAGYKGGTRNIIGSLSYFSGGPYYGDSPPWPGTDGVPQTTSAIITLQRSVNGGAWTTLVSTTVTGTREWSWMGREYGYTINCGGSISYTDTTGGTGPINYRVVLSNPINWPFNYHGVQTTMIQATEG